MNEYFYPLLKNDCFVIAMFFNQVKLPSLHHSHKPAIALFWRKCFLCGVVMSEVTIFLAVAKIEFGTTPLPCGVCLYKFTGRIQHITEFFKNSQRICFCIGIFQGLLLSPVHIENPTL